MTAAAMNPKPQRVFVCIAALIYLANYAFASFHARSAPVPEWPVAVDLFLVVPALYLILYRPPLRQAIIGLLALVSIGILVGSFVIPQDDKQTWVALERVRWVYLGALLAAQVALIAAVLRDIRMHRSAPNIETAVHDAIAKRFPEPTAHGLLQADARVWLYALVRRRDRFALPEPAFYGWKHDSNASNQQAFLILIAAEIPLAHAVIHLFSPVAAWVVTAATLYGLVFLYAEYRATLLRATTLESTFVHVRHGVLGDLRIPYASIWAVERVDYRPRRQQGVLRFVGTGTANLKLCLHDATRLQTLFGLRETQAVYLGLDTPAAFEHALTLRLRD